MVALPNKAIKRGFPLRNLRIHNTQSFQFWLKFVRMYTEPTKSYNLYYSLATFKNGIPFRNTKEGNLKEDFKEWNQIAPKNIIAFDFPIDVDAGNFDEMPFAIESAILIQDYLNKHNVPYNLRFSGMGFHFVIPYAFLPQHLSLDPNDDVNIYQYMHKIATKLNNNITEMIDTTIYDSRRILKIPMSVSIYENVDYVCAPVSDMRHFDIENYKLANYKSSNILKPDELHNPSGNVKIWQNELPQPTK